MRTLLVILSLFIAATSYSQVVGTSTSADSLGSSTQQKSFVDEANQTVYQFYYDGTQVVAKSSVDSTNWVNAATLPYNTSDFSVYFRDGRVYVAIAANTYDVVVRRGTITNGTIAFEGEVTALDGTSATDRYLKPNIIVRDDSRVFIAAANTWSTFANDVYPVETQSVGVGTLSFSAPTRIASPEEDIQSVVLVYPGSGTELSAFIHNEENTISHHRYDGVNWSEANIGGDTRTGGLLGRDLQLNDQVNAMVEYDGLLYLGGQFTRAGDDPQATYLATWDGENYSSVADTAIPGNEVDALAVYDGRLYLGGFFFGLGGDPNANYLAVFDGQSFSSVADTALSQHPDAFAVYGGNLYIGGYFTDAGGDPNADGLAVYDGVSITSVANTPFSLGVSALAVYGGELYIGGSFTDAGGDPSADNLAVYDGTTFSSVAGTSLSSRVRALQVHNGNLYIGGDFINAAGDPNADRFAVYDGVSISSVPGTTGVSDSIFGFGVYGGDLYLVGEFLNAGGDPDADLVAVYDGVGLFSVAGTRFAGFRARCALAYDGDLYVGGEMGISGVIGTSHLVSYDGVGFSSVRGRPGAIPGSVNALEIFNNQLYIGGSFTNAGGDPDADYLAIYDGTTVSSVTGTALDGFVTALKVYNNELYIGGDFTNAGGDPNADRLAVFDGAIFSSVNNSPLSASVFALEVYNNDLYIGGDFLNAGGVGSADRLAVYDGVSIGSVAGTALSDTVRAFGVYNDDLYIGGAFLNAGGDGNADRLAVFDGVGISSVASTPFASTVLAFTVYDNELYIGGSFTNHGGDPLADIVVSFDGVSFDNLGSSIYNAYSVTDLASFEGELFIAGSGFVSLRRYDGTSISWGGFRTGRGVNVVLEHGDKLYFGSEIGLGIREKVVGLDASVFSVSSSSEVFYGGAGVSSRLYNVTNWEAASSVTGDTVRNIVAGDLSSFWITAAGSLESSSGNIVGDGVGSELSISSSSDTSFHTYSTGSGPYTLVSGFDGVGLDDDFDDDGLTNDEEATLGTDPNNPDTDGDGLNDGDEVNTHNSSPLLADTDSDGIDDSSEVSLGYNINSHEYPLTSPAYLGWNTFMEVTNILELSNRSNTFQTISVEILDASGVAINAFVTGLTSGEKRDIFLSGFLPENAYGNIKLDFISHSLRARTTQFYPNFIYHNEARNPLTGNSYVLYNTNDPTTSGTLSVENWLSISNLGSSEEFFTVSKYNELGEVVETNGVSISARGRVDVNGGANGEAAGHIKIEPSNPSTNYLASLVRQGYDQTLVYQYAANTEALAISSTTYASLHGNTYIELANVCDYLEDISISVYQEDGTADFQNLYALEPNTHTHIGTQVTGYVHASSTNPCIIMSVLRYQGDVTGLSTSEGQYPRDGMVSGRYNTFLNQTPTLLISNTSSTTESVSITFRDATGGTSTESVSLEPKASFQMQVPAPENSYGTIDVTASSIMASVLYSSPSFADSLECR